MFAEEIAIPRTRSRRRTLPPIAQAAALYEHRVPPPPPVMQRLATLGDRVAQLKAALASLQTRLDLATASVRRDR
jgi:hypothetical protein